MREQLIKPKSQAVHEKMRVCNRETLTFHSVSVSQYSESGKNKTREDFLYSLLPSDCLSWIPVYSI